MKKQRFGTPNFGSPISLFLVSILVSKLDNGIVGVLGQEELLTHEEYKLVVVSDGGSDQEMDYVQYLNATAERTGGDLLLFAYVPVSEPPTADDKARLCDALLDGDFILSIGRSEGIQAMVRDISLASKIPTIQVNYQPWMYPKSMDASVNGTADPVTGMINGTNMVAVDVRDEVPVSNYVSVVMPSTVLYNVFYSLVNSVNITQQVRVLYDNTYDIKDPTWQDMLRQTKGYEFSFTEMPLNDTDMATQIKKLKSMSGPDNKKVKTLLLMASTTNIEKYLEQARPEMESKRFDWFVLSKDIKSFQCEMCTTVYAFWMRADQNDEAFERITQYKTYLEEKDLRDMINTENELEVSFFLDLTNIVWDYILTLNGTAWSYPSYGCDTNRTLESAAAADSVNKTVSLTEFLYELPPVGSYGEYLPATSSLETTEYFQNIAMQLLQIEFVKESNLMKTMGNWTVIDGIIEEYPERGLIVAKLEEIKHYKIAIVAQPPFIEKYTNKDGVTDYRGYCIDLIEKIREEVGFTYELYEVKDKMYGTINDQGEWNGLIGELIKGAAEIALAPLSVMAERENFVDFTVPYYDLVGTTILMRRQEPNYSLFKFMTVLEPQVWFCIIGAYFFTSFLLWIFDKFSPYSYSNNKEKYKDDPEKREFTFKECLWFCMTSLTPQGGGEAPKNISGRLVAATWWLFGFIIIASYTANLAAFLTVSRLETPISSLDDLAKQYKIKYAPVRGTASETYFKRMSEIEERFYDIWKDMSLNESMTPQDRAKLAVWDYPVSDKFTNMWRYMKEAGLPNSTEDAIQKVLDSPSTTDGFAYIGDATEIRYAELTDCRLQMVGNEFSRKPYAIAVQQGSKLKDKISSAILKLLNKRDLETLKETWWSNNPNKVDCPRVEDESDGISIQNIGGVFIVILVGIALSILTLAFEYWYYKDRPRKGDGVEYDGNSHSLGNLGQVIGSSNGTSGNSGRNGSGMFGSIGGLNDNNNELKEVNGGGNGGGGGGGGILSSRFHGGTNHNNNNNNNGSGLGGKYENGGVIHGGHFNSAFDSNT